ncbi:hypothetical protein CRYUN_Cryun41cG0040000 [Craigia yunnanensis]
MLCFKSVYVTLLCMLLSCSHWPLPLVRDARCLLPLLCLCFFAFRLCVISSRKSLIGGTPAIFRIVSEDRYQVLLMLPDAWFDVVECYSNDNNKTLK